MFAIAAYESVPETLYGYTLVQEHPRYRVWEKDGEQIVAFKGTSFRPETVIQDILDDSQIAFGNPCDLSLIQGISVSESVTFTGHSLGGTAALCMAKKYPQSRAVSFNGGAPLTNQVQGPGPQRARHYHVEGDLISSHLDPKMAEIIRVRMSGPSWGTVYPHETKRFLESGDLITANQEQASFNRWGGTLLKPITCMKPIPGSTVGCFT